LRCRVVWSRRVAEKGFVYGLQFSDEQTNIDHSWAHYYMRQIGFNPHQAIKRRARRVACELKAILTADEDSLSFEVSVVDIGTGGARLFCKEEISKSLMVMLAIDGDAPAGGFRLRSRIVQVRVVGSQYQLNLRFLNRPDSPEMANLSQFLMQLVRQEQSPK
jgi:hypothetical protein